MVNETFISILKLDSECVGYSIQELEKMELLYDVNFAGSLKLFMQLAGRSAGKTLGDDFSMLYSSSMSVRDHIFYQEGRRVVLSDHVGLHEWTLEKPFFFSESSFSYMFFVKTRPKDANDTNKVFCLDENEDSVSEEPWDFDGFILDRIKKRKKKPPKNNLTCQGEMLIVK